jgi:hypothetical protein
MNPLLVGELKIILLMNPLLVGEQVNLPKIT